MYDYQEKVQACLLKKRWFSKVEALENYTDFWTFGRGIKSMNKRGGYMPVRTNIMPRPKFKRNDNKEDEIGQRFGLRTKDLHTVSPFMEEHSTLKPVAMQPKVQSRDRYFTFYNYQHLKDPKFDWKMPKRINKKGNKKVHVLQYPTSWKFSTFIQRNEEKKVQPQTSYVPVSIFSQLYTYVKNFK